jgi:hypothetical protein
MRLKWKLVSVHLEIVLILTQDWYVVCAEHTIGFETISKHLMELLDDVAHVESRLVHSETVLVPEQDRCTICTKHTLGLEIVLDGPNGTPR